MLCWLGINNLSYGKVEDCLDSKLIYNRLVTRDYIMAKNVLKNLRRIEKANEAFSFGRWADGKNEWD